MTRFSPLPTVTSRCQPRFGNVFPLPITTLPLGYQNIFAAEESSQHFENIGEIGSTSVAKALRCQLAKTSIISTISTFPPPPKGGGVCLATHTPPTSDWVFHCQAVATPEPMTRTDFHGEMIMTMTALIEPLTDPLTDLGEGHLVVLAIDLGTKSGWALHGHDGQITSGTIEFRNDRWQGGGMRFLRFKRWLTEIKQMAGGLDAVFVEEVRRHVGVDAAHAYGGFLAHVTAWCEHHQIPYEAVPVGTIKRHATGKGNANKDAVIAAMRGRGFKPADDNEADALALLCWAMDHRMGGPS